MTAIEFNNISKQYRLGLVSTRTLSHDLNRWWKMNMLRQEDPYLTIGETNDRAHRGESDYVWALRDIDFKVEQGDVLGIIGKNGAGKSTLLKILSKVTAPTTGTIKARGRIASLLEVGTGFHPEMTGRENIYMNGAIMGMTKAEISRKLDEIVDFSGVERYIDTPVKRYSSGMMVRLGFAVAAHLEPEILVVDEVLAVGDAEFQKKAIGKMQDVSQGEGRTVLFVSHNMESIRKLCSQGLLLQNGTISYIGDIEETVNLYQRNYYEFNKTLWINENYAAMKSEAFFIKSFYLEFEGKILSEEKIEDGDELFVNIEYFMNSEMKDITIGISLFDNSDNYIYRTLQSDIKENLIVHKMGFNKIRAKLNTDILKTGIYHAVLDVSQHNIMWYSNPFEETKRVLFFTKNQLKSTSSIHASAATINPIIKWNKID